MAEASDWRSARHAEALMTLDREQFAVEFLRRNPAYVEDYNNTRASIESGELPAAAALAQLARRWGLSFPPSA